MTREPIRFLWIRMFASRILDAFGGPGWLFLALMVLAIYLDWLFRAT